MMRDDRVVEGLHERGSSRFEDETDVAPHADAVNAAAMGRFRPHGPHAGFDVRDRPRIGEQHVLNPRTDRTNGQIGPGILLDLHHAGEMIEQIDGPPDVFECVQIVRGIFAHELDIVEHLRVADQFDDRRPRNVQMRAQSRLSGIEQLTQSITTHARLLSSKEKSAQSESPFCGTSRAEATPGGPYLKTVTDPSAVPIAAPFANAAQDRL